MGKKMPPQGKLMRERDWKSLIVLDACRFEEFKKTCDIRGSLMKVNSQATDTISWYNTHFKESSWSDTILLSAQPQPFKLGDIHESFSGSFLLWDADDPRRVNPEKSLEKARKIMRTQTEKKYIVHLIPPHLPWIGNKGKKLGQEIYGGSDQNKQKLVTRWANRNDGWVKVKECYIESLSVALDTVKQHLDEMEKTVITTDHSNMLGENNEYGHHSDHPKLRVAPWFSCEA